MNESDRPAPIPVPLKERWRDVRMRVIPVLVFAGAVSSLALLWKDYVAAPTMVGQAEPVLANVTSHKAGVLAELTVNRFQRVRAGDAVGKVLVTDPRVLASSLAVIQAEIDSLRASMKPVVTHQRAAVDYDQLRLEWMRQRAELATAKVNLQLADSELRRTEDLYKEKIVSQQLFEQALAARDGMQGQVYELSNLVCVGEQHIKDLQLTNAPEVSKISVDPLQAAIAVQESKLHLTEAELSPIVLRAPIDGIVSTVFHRSGEAVTAGQPIVAVATHNPVRIVGYLRPPIQAEPKPGMMVQVRTRGLHREVAMAKVVEVGTQLENMPAVVLGQMKLAGVELGLPVDITVPPTLNIRPGELVDLTLVTAVQ